MTLLANGSAMLASEKAWHGIMAIQTTIFERLPLRNTFA